MKKTAQTPKKSALNRGWYKTLAQCRLVFLKQDVMFFHPNKYFKSHADKYDPWKHCYSINLCDSEILEAHSHLKMTYIQKPNEQHIHVIKRRSEKHHPNDRYNYIDLIEQ